MSGKIKAAETLKELMGAYYIEAKNAGYNNQKIAWITSGAPVELLHCFDIIPVYPENHGAMCGVTKMGAGLAQAAESLGYSPDLCAYFRIDVGTSETGGGPIAGLPEPDMLVCSNNICKTVIKWYEIQSRRYNCPLVMVDMPFCEDEIQPYIIDYVVNQMKNEYIPICERISGIKFDQEKFFSVLMEADRSVSLWGEILDCCRHKPAPLSSFDAFIHMGPIVTLRGLPKCGDYYDVLLAEMKDRIAQGIGAIDNEQHRLVWDNIPVWFAMKKLGGFFAERGAALVAATYTSSWAVMTKFSEGDPWKNLAEAYLSPYINRGFYRRVKILADLMEKYFADGFVLHSARSCKTYSFGQYGIREELTRITGKPGVVIEADIADERNFSEAQVMVRLEAFMESLNAE